MFTRLFGETDNEQFVYLKKKVLLTFLGLFLGLVGILLASFQQKSMGQTLCGIAGAILLISLFLWGFGAIKRLFGIATIGAIFSRNVVLGVVIFVFCLMIAYLISIFIAFMGIGRYIYLNVKFSKERR